MSDFVDKVASELADIRARIDVGTNLGNWWTWTQADFQNWCDSNLMTDAQIDATTLSTALKTNLKSNNLYIRNSGKLLIVARDIIKWLVRNV